METVEESAQLLLSPELSSTLIILSLAINVVLLLAFAYLFVSRKHDERFEQIDKNFKKISNTLKNLESRLQEKRPAVMHTLPDMKPFGMDFSEEDSEETSAPAEKKNSGDTEYAELWEKLVKEYNRLAANINVPKPLEACEKFVFDNDMRMLMYGGAMNFLPAIDVSESNYWAWKIPETKNIFAVVPNPTRPCDKVVYNGGGIKDIFDSNFQSSVYRVYVVDKPAIFINESGSIWTLQEKGKLNLQKNF